MKSHGLKKALCQWTAMLALVVSGAVWAANGVDFSQSPEVSGTQEGAIRMPKEQDRMPLNYVNQPPMIPHSVEGYQVTTNTNRCLQCHGVEVIAPLARRALVLLTLWTATAKWARKWLRVVISVCNVTYRRPIPRQSWGIPLPHQKVTGNKRLLWEILTVSLV